MPKKKFKKPWERKGVLSMPHGRGIRVHTIIKDYIASDRYNSLASSSKKMYLSAINALEQIILPNGKTILDAHVHNIEYGTADFVKRVLSFNLKPATISLYFSMFSSVWYVALRNGKAAYNPWSKANIKINNIRDVIWTPEQLKIAVDTSKELGFHLLALYISIAYHTGMRPWSDLRNLKWSNLKLDKGGQYVVDFIIQKTSIHLLLPLAPEAAELLNSLPKISKYIFVTEDNRRFTQVTLTNQFNKVKKYACLDPNLTIRDLRRTAVTEMAQAGATTQEIQAMTGWRIPDAMLKRYAVLKLSTAKTGLEKRTKFRNESSAIS